MREDRAGLAQLARAFDEHRHFAHLVDILAVLRRPRFAVEIIDENRLPARADQRQHQRRLVGIAGLREAIELILGHGLPDWRASDDGVPSLPGSSGSSPGMTSENAMAPAQRIVGMT